MFEGGGHVLTWVPPGALDMERNNFGTTDSGMLTSSSAEGYFLVISLQ